MEILIGQQIEDARIQKKRELTKPTWEHYTTYDYTEAIDIAKEMGWKDKKVQVKRYAEGGRWRYVIEPYEENCGCPSLILPPDDGYLLGD